MRERVVFEVSEHERQVRWCDPADPFGLSQIQRPNLGELFFRFVAKWSDSVVIKRNGNRLLRMSRLLVDFGLLAIDVAGVLDVDRALFRRTSTDARELRDLLGDHVPGHLGTTQVDITANGWARFGLNLGLFQQLGSSFDLSQLLMEPFASSGIDQTQFIGLSGQSAVGIVLSQKQPVFSAAGEHSVGLVGAARHQIVDQHADVSVLSGRHPRRFRCGSASGIQARDQALAGGFFVPSCAVDLAGKEQPRNGFGFQVRPQLSRRAVVVFDGVPVSHDRGVFQAGNASEHRVLNITRQAGRDPVDVDLASLPAFGFEEQLVAGLVGKANDFVFDRRAITRASGIDLAAVHRGSIQVRSNQIMHTFVGVRDVARHLGQADCIVEIAERLRVIVAGLLLQSRVIDRASVEPWRRPGFEAIQRETHSVQRAAQSRRGSFSRASSGGLRFASVHDRLQERAGRQDHRRRVIDRVPANSHPDDSLIGQAVLSVGDRFCDQVLDGFLPQVKVGLGLDPILDEVLVGLFVRLSTGAVHRRAFAAVEHPKLDSRGVDRFAHQAAQGVDFADDLTFGDSTDGWVAGHLPDRVQIRRQESRFGAQASCSGGGFGSRMTGSDNDDIVVVTILRIVSGQWLKSTVGKRRCSKHGLSMRGDARIDVE